MSTIFWKNEIDFYRISLRHQFIETSSTRKYWNQVVKGRAQQNPFEQTVIQINLAAFFWIGGVAQYQAYSATIFQSRLKYYNQQCDSKVAVAVGRKKYTSSAFMLHLAHFPAAMTQGFWFLEWWRGCVFFLPQWLCSPAYVGLLSLFP